MKGGRSAADGSALPDRGLLHPLFLPPLIVMTASSAVFKSPGVLGARGLGSYVVYEMGGGGTAHYTRRARVHEAWGCHPDI